MTIKNRYIRKPKYGIYKEELPNWYGIEGIKFIYRNEWADPEIAYGDYILNQYLILESMELEYDELKEEGLIPNDMDFDRFMETEGDRVKECIEDCIFINTVEI